LKDIDAICKTISALTSKTMRLESRCDALEIALGVVSQKAGIPHEKIHKVVKDMTALTYQKRLERIEGLDPATADELDTRPTMPDLPTDLL
jgi:hypothetical protein